MSIKSAFKDKTFITIISLLLIMALGATIFGIEYTSVVKDINNSNSKIELIEKENAKLKSENESNKAQAQEEITKNNQLNSKINKLESEISQIKLTKAQNSSNKKPTTTKQNTVKVDMSLLKKPNTGSKVCYLTFDDGPSINTIKILDILKEANAKASFFVVGERSKLSYIKRTQAEGHTVALHTNTHEYNLIYKSEKAYFNDLKKISDKVKAEIGIEPKIMRFPGGSSNIISKSYNKGIMTRLTKQMASKGYTYVDWNVDSGDASGNGVAKSKILKNIQSGSKAKGDICVLMHDSAVKTTTADALPEIICYLRGRGYRFEALTTQSPTFHHSVNN